MDTGTLSHANINNTEPAIPERLRTLARWKVSDSKNPGYGWNLDENLRTYDKACDHARKIGADGVVYIVGKDDPFTFVDLDDCRNPQTGEVAPWAAQIVKELDSYTEISSSGKGLHIITEAEKPGPRCRVQDFRDFEMYDDVRPALITGDRINDKDIEPRQQQIEALYTRVFPEQNRAPVDVKPTGLNDDEVLEWVLRQDPNAPKFRTVYNGEWGEHYPSQSEADFGLVSKLLSYSGDPDQVERLMLNSGLYHEKYDSMRGPITYLRQTIDNALDRLEWLYKPGKGLLTVGKKRTPRKGLLAGAVPLGEMMRDGIEHPEELIPGVILEGRTHQMFCGPGKGKTFVALWVAVRLINRGKRVLYLDKENGARIVGERLLAMGADPAKIDANLVYVPFPSLDQEPDAVQDYIESLDGFSLVIFDSWINYLAAAGLDENSNGDLARWSNTFCAEARQRNISVLLLDHVGKDSGNGSRGASRKLDEMDVAWELRTLIPFDREQKGMIQLRRKKDREAWLSPTVEFEIGGDPFVMQRLENFEVQEPDSIKNTLGAIEGFGADGARFAAWEQATNDLGTGRTQFTEARKELLADGRVVKSGNLYHAARFSPGAQPDLMGEHLVRDPEPDLTGLDEKNAQNPHEQRENLSGGGAGLENNSSPQRSPVRVPSLSGDRAGLVDQGGVETDQDANPDEIRERLRAFFQRDLDRLKRSGINVWESLGFGVPTDEDYDLIREIRNEFKGAA